MGIWGCYDDQNDDVCDLVCKLEETINNTSKECNNDNKCNRCQYRSFKKLINLDKLRRYDDSMILGVLVNYTRVESIDILASSDFAADLPKSLPDNYPESYKQLAHKAIKNMDGYIIMKNLKLESWKNPQKRFDAFQAEKLLFSDN